MTNVNEMCARAKAAGNINEIETWLKDNQLSVDQAKDLAAFMTEASYSEMIGCWKAAQTNVENLKTIHPFVCDMLVKRTTEGGDGGYGPRGAEPTVG